MIIHNSVEERLIINILIHLFYVRTIFQSSSQRNGIISIISIAMSINQSISKPKFELNYSKILAMQNFLLTFEHEQLSRNQCVRRFLYDLLIKYRALLMSLGRFFYVILNLINETIYFLFNYR
jgi:hypothetical protein